MQVRSLSAAKLVDRVACDDRCALVIVRFLQQRVCQGKVDSRRPPGITTYLNHLSLPLRILALDTASLDPT